VKITLTGASGVVGQSILRELERRGRINDVICLTRHGDVGVLGVESLKTEITRPDLGLTARDYDHLVETTDVIVHAGALTEWGRPEDEYRSANVDGTRHVIELARACDAPIHHLSTSFVAALRNDADVKLRPDNIVTNYIRSKQETNELVRGSGQPYNIYLPTNLIGDSDTGESSRGQIVRLVANRLLGGRLPLFPAHEGNPIDIVAQDILAIAVLNAIDRGVLGNEYWVTYGGAAMDVPTVLKMCADRARAIGRQVDAPEVVHPECITAEDLDRMPPMTRSLVRLLIDTSEVTAASGGALPTSMPALHSQLGVPEVSDVAAFERNLMHWTGSGH
jgi:thioester reductase-like protein